MYAVKSQRTIARVALCIIALCGIVAAQKLIAAPEQKVAVATFGGYAISRNITSLWLAGPDRRPLLMVYFHGPKDWGRTRWNMSSNFGKGNPAWAELRSENATLRLELNPETQEVTVQFNKFKLRENNTFLVLHTGELFVPQKLIPLGFFDIPSSNGKPASLLLLQAHLDVVVRINKETRCSDLGSTLNRFTYPPFIRPCKQKHINFVPRAPGMMVEGAFVVPPLIARGELLSSSYTMPCSLNPVSYTTVH